MVLGIVVNSITIILLNLDTRSVFNGMSRLHCSSVEDVFVNENIIHTWYFLPAGFVSDGSYAERLNFSTQKSHHLVKKTVFWRTAREKRPEPD